MRVTGEDNHDAAPPYRRYRQLAATPLRYRDLHDRFAEGDIDFRGTLGVAKDTPVGFAQIRLAFQVETDAPDDKLARLLELTERYCVVYQTLRSPPPVAVTSRMV